jgi:hypothetical protein
MAASCPTTVFAEHRPIRMFFEDVVGAFDGLEVHRKTGQCPVPGR